MKNWHPASASTLYMQEETKAWFLACFPEDTAMAKAMRLLRFMEEAIELFQAAGGTPEKLYELIDQVFANEPGELPQEFGGTYTTFMLLATVYDLDAGLAGLTELRSAYERIEKIRAKSHAKVKPGASRRASRFEYLMWLHEFVLMPKRPDGFAQILAEKFEEATGKEAPCL